MRNIDKIIESVIDPKRDTLSPHLFENVDGVWVLLPNVRSKILKMWSKISRLTPIKHVVIVGGCSTFNYTEDSDVDVSLETKIETNKNKLINIASKISGIDHAGPHEINYHITNKLPIGNYDSIYDVVKNKWLRGPSAISLDINKYLRSFNEIVDDIDQAKAELLEDLIDYSNLKHAQEDNLAHAQESINIKLSEINENIDELSNYYNIISIARKAAFSNATPEDIAKFGSKNKLPENVIYLLLRKYCYVHFLHAIKSAKHHSLRNVADAYFDYDSCNQSKQHNTQQTTYNV